MSNRIRNLLIQVQLWRILGFMSSVVGLLCYARSSSFKNLFGEWSPLKIFLYTVVSLIITNITLFAYKWKHSKSFLCRCHVSFLFLLLTSLYSYLTDKSVKVKPDVLSLICSAAFAFMSFSLSMQNHLGFETDLLQFYLGLFILQLMEISFKLALLGAAFCYSFLFLHSYLQCSRLEPAPTTITTLQHHVPLIEIDTCPNDLTKQLHSILGIEREISETQAQDTLIYNYPPDFESKLKHAIACGFVEECYHVFITWRKQFLSHKLLDMGFQKLRIEEVHKLPLKYLKDDIEQWAKAYNDVVKILFPHERHLCNVVFSGSSPLDDLSFMEVCRGLTTQLLNYATAVSSTTQSPERLFRTVDVLETLEDLLPNMESLFSNQHCGFLYDDVISTLKRLEEAIRGVFMELENLIRQDPAKVVVSGGGLHPTNRYVMNYLRAACQYRKTLERVFEDNQVSSSSSSSSSSLYGQMGRIVELLESNLEANSKIYEDSPLCSVFMMNNGRYIVHKAKNSELGKVLGDEWMQKHIGKVRQCLVSYQRSSWDGVLEMLNILDYESLAPSHAKEKLDLFKLQIEEICERQSTWVVFDEQLRNVITSSLKKIVLLAYENFLVTFQNHVETGDFGVQDIEALINKLFLGKDEYTNPKNVQPTWTVVMGGAKDFHEWRRYGEKTIPNSPHPRKYYRCIYKNDQGCGARKHVQQIQQNPKMYKTSYSGFHTCTMLLKAPQVPSKTQALQH